MSSSKEAALKQIAALVEAHDIDLEEIAGVTGQESIARGHHSNFTLVRIFAYLGGIFLLAGLGIYVERYWSDMNSPARIAVTLGPGIGCLMLALAHMRQGKSGINVTVLILLSALLQSAGLFVTLAECFPSSGDIHTPQIIVYSALAFQYGLLFYSLRQGTLLFFAFYFAIGAFAILCDAIGMPHAIIELICGLTVLMVSYGLQRTPYHRLCGFGYFVSSVTLLWMGFDAVEGTMLELAYLGFAAFMLYVSAVVRSHAILVNSTLALFSFISYYTARYFSDSLGWPLSLMLLGGVFFALSNLSLRLHTRMKV